VKILSLFVIAVTLVTPFASASTTSARRCADTLGNRRD
jgi:hypothetical protein